MSFSTVTRPSSKGIAASSNQKPMMIGIALIVSVVAIYFLVKLFKGDKTDSPPPAAPYEEHWDQDMPDIVRNDSRSLYKLGLKFVNQTSDPVSIGSFTTNHLNVYSPTTKIYIKKTDGQQGSKDFSFNEPFVLQPGAQAWAILNQNFASTGSVPRYMAIWKGSSAPDCKGNPESCQQATVFDSNGVWEISSTVADVFANMTAANTFAKEFSQASASRIRLIQLK